MLNIVCALACEAKPVIKRLGLEPRVAGGRFRIYTAEETTLVVSGDGKAAVAAAVGYVMGRSTAGSRPAWLNVGVAGHGERNVGDAILPHKVIDNATGDVFYPTLVFEPPCPTDSLLTVDQPVGRGCPYPGGTACDMEASAFFATASRFSPLEFVHALKIVSDNASSNVDTLTAELAESLIEKHLDLVEVLSTTLSRLQRQYESTQSRPQGLGDFLSQWRFSATQARQLEGHLHRWQALADSNAVDWNEYQALPNARSVLDKLEGAINALPLRL